MKALIEPATPAQICPSAPANQRQPATMDKKKAKDHGGHKKEVSGPSVESNPGWRNQDPRKQARKEGSRLVRTRGNMEESGPEETS